MLLLLLHLQEIFNVRETHWAEKLTFVQQIQFEILPYKTFDFLDKI